MRYSKRTISALLLAAMLSACACTNTGVSDDTSTSGGDTTTDAAVETGEYVKPDVNYNGETFTILDYDTDEYFYQACSYSDINAEEGTGDTINDAQWKRNRAVEEALGITLKTYPVGGSDRKAPGNELRTLIMAQEDVVDAGSVFGTSLSALLAEPGYLINLNDIDTLNYEASWWDQAAIETYSFDGNFKVMTGDANLYRSFAPMVYYYNKNVAEMYSEEIDDCYQLVRDGKWTFDVVYEYSRAVAEDLNGDQKMDENDRYGTACQTHLVTEMLMASGERFTKFNESGELELVLYNERSDKAATTFVEFLNDINVNCQAQQFSSMFSNVFFELHIPMFKNDQLLFNYQQLLIANDLRSMETDYGLLPTPKFDETQEDYCTNMSNSFLTYIVVPSTNTNLEMTGHVLDALGYYSQQMVTPAFIDATVRAKSLRDEDSAEMLDIILNTAVYDLAIIYDWGTLQSSVKKLTILNQSFSTLYASLESAALAEMAETMELMTE